MRLPQSGSRRRLAVAMSPASRVINVEGNPSYPHVVTELMQSGELGAGAVADPSHN
jgi:hypothetical protein